MRTLPPTAGRSQRHIDWSKYSDVTAIGGDIVTTNSDCIVWQRSRACEANACVEVASVGGAVLVRDSKDPDGPVLRFARDEWLAFVEGIRLGDLPEG